MAVYKVAQDVEADDKLLGPFTFRQFIYLIIVVIAGALAYGLSRIFVPLFVIPLPVILFFGALALPLRKDQPMEVYLAALLSFYLKPRKRVWIPDGIESLVEITAPKIPEIQRTKDLSETEAERRLSYLADIVDTEGWAVRRTSNPEETNSSMKTDAFYEASQATDILDDSSGLNQSFDDMIAKATERHRQEAVAKMYQAINPPVTSQAPVNKPQPIQNQDQVLDTTPISTPVSAQEPTVNPTFNPYPNIKQSVIQPIDDSKPVEPVPGNQDMNSDTNQQSKPQANTTSDIAPTPDIINLAKNSSNLSVQTLSREANRINDKNKSDESEVFISLRG